MKPVTKKCSKVFT